MEPDFDQALAVVRDGLERAAATGRRNTNAMTLATVGADGAPSARTVLLRAVDERGLVFFTDARSRKGRQLAGDPRAAGCLYWEPLEEQITVEGPVEALDAAAVAEDFALRPPGGRVLVHASEQSAVIEDDRALRARVESLSAREAESPLAPPGHWRGFRLVPVRIEHWRGQRDRVHLRTAWRRDGTRWIGETLSP